MIVSSTSSSSSTTSIISGAGGGGAMMIYTPSKEPIIYDFFVDTPPRTGKEELDFFDVEVDFGDSTQIFHMARRISNHKVR